MFDHMLTQLGAVAQAGVNVASIIAASAGPVALGGFTRLDVKRGWANFWVRMQTHRNPKTSFWLTE
jgi:hypothetical protein